MNRGGDGSSPDPLHYRPRFLILILIHRVPLALGLGDELSPPRFMVPMQAIIVQPYGFCGHFLCGTEFRVRVICPTQRVLYL